MCHRHLPILIQREFVHVSSYWLKMISRYRRLSAYSALRRPLRVREEDADINEASHCHSSGLATLGLRQRRRARLAQQARLAKWVEDSIPDPVVRVKYRFSVPPPIPLPTPMHMFCSCEFSLARVVVTCVFSLVVTVWLIPEMWFAVGYPAAIANGVRPRTGFDF